MSTKMRRIGTVALVLGTILAIYFVEVRPWLLSWGATETERTAFLPGDLIVPGARREATRALTIDAPAATVWPWLAQLGQDRAGFYSYEVLEDLVGARMPREDVILMDRQEWRVNDFLWMYPPDKAQGYGGAPLLEFLPGRALGFGVWQLGTPHSRPPDASWSFVLEPIGVDRTRLMVRSRAAGGEPWVARLFNLAISEPAHFVMERKMMENIKALAEGRRPASRTRDGVTVLVWTLTIALLVWAAVAAVRRERWVRPVACVAGAALAFQLQTLVQPPVLVATALLLGWVLVLAIEQIGAAVEATI